VCASENGHTDIVIALLNRANVDVNHHRHGETALLLASKNGHTYVVVELLKRDEVEVNLDNKDGCTALMLASCLQRPYGSCGRIVEAQ
jgi:ankyrin repeat protein